MYRSQQVSYKWQSTTASMTHNDRCLFRHCWRLRLLLIESRSVLFNLHSSYKTHDRLVIIAAY